MLNQSVKNQFGPLDDLRSKPILTYTTGLKTETSLTNNLDSIVGSFEKVFPLFPSIISFKYYFNKEKKRKKILKILSIKVGKYLKKKINILKNKKKMILYNLFIKNLKSHKVSFF